jgi:hypothetical protein
MSAKDSIKYNVSIAVEEIKLPPFQDILIMGKKSSHGKVGMFKSVDFLVPNEFKFIEINNDEKVEAILVSKKILTKMPEEKVIDILQSRVFKFISEGELLKVDFKVSIHFDNIENE